MTAMTLEQLSTKMGKIDFAMLSTRAADDAIASRPMSNNGQVDYSGDNFFFAHGHASLVSDIERDARVGLTFTGAVGLLGGPPLFIAIEGEAELIRDRAEITAHWTSDLNRWFDKGIDTPGIVLIKVHTNRLHYWSGADQGELTP